MCAGVVVWWCRAESDRISDVNTKSHDKPIQHRAMLKIKPKLIPPTLQVHFAAGKTTTTGHVQLARGTPHCQMGVLVLVARTDIWTSIKYEPFTAMEAGEK